MSPPLYKTWLPFFVVTTILTLAAGRHVENFAGEPDQLDGKFFGIWAVNLLASAVFTYLGFRWTVAKYFATPGGSISESRIVRAWLMYFIAYTVGGYLLGIAVGVVVGSVVLASSAQVDPTGWKFMLIGVVFSAAPASLASFRWSVTKFILPAAVGQQSPPTVRA